MNLCILLMRTFGHVIVFCFFLIVAEFSRSSLRFEYFLLVPLFFIRISLKHRKKNFNTSNGIIEVTSSGCAGLPKTKKNSRHIEGLRAFIIPCV